MKKKSLLMLAGLSMLLCSCGGTAYKNVAKETDGDNSIEQVSTLRLNGKADGAGSYSLTIKNTEKYPNGIEGFLGIGEVEGDLTVVTTSVDTGTWEASDAENVISCTAEKSTLKYSISGKGEDDYKDILEDTLSIIFDEETVAKLVDEKEVEVDTAGITLLYKLNEEDKTFSSIVG